MATLYAFKNFNNYYNRKLKKYDNLNDYPEPEFIESQNLNFNTNDGINTNIVLGRPQRNDYLGDCDYLIYSDDNTSITSRWFIIEQKRKMNAQYDVTLHRDVIADNWDKLLTSECFIEKATLPKNSPLIFNQESMTTNQIKKNQTLLKDLSETPWAVLYLNKNRAKFSGTVLAQPKIVAKNIGSDLEHWVFYNYISTINGKSDVPGLVGKRLGKSVSDGTFKVEGFSWEFATDCFIKFGKTETSAGYEHKVPNPRFFFSPKPIQAARDMRDYYSNHNVTWRNRLNSIIPYTTEYISSADYNSVLALHGKNIVTTDGRYFTVSVETGTYTKEGITIPHDTNGLWNSIKSDMWAGGILMDRDYSEVTRAHTATMTYQYVRMNLVELFNEEVTWDLSGQDKIKTLDAPYDIVAIPLRGIILDDFTGGTQSSAVHTTEGESFVMSLVNSIIAKGGGESPVVYDAQLLPYCPLQQSLTSRSTIRIDDNSKQVTYVNDTHGNPLTAIFYVPASKFEFNIMMELPCGTNAAERKLNNQVDLWRLCSPDFSNYFEFSVEKNDGVSLFNVDCEYKPFTPYVHLNPDFKNFYGADYNTPLGLICGSNCSLTTVSDNWATYERQNKNYLEIFGREKTNLNVMHSYQKEQATWGMVTGTVATGVMAGMATGSIAGGLVGAGVSAIAGSRDLEIMQGIHNETLNYREDMFKYQLGNIQALPATLSKVSAYNPNNPIFPVLEYYTCTDTEKEAFLNKIAWNGMSVGVIGKIEDYLGNDWSYNGIKDKGYIKAKLIRLEDVDEDFHNVNAIADELNKGVYVK